MAATDAPPVLRVSIGEDDVLLREGIARILSGAGLNVVAQAGDADELVRRTLAYRPDVAIVDVQMPPRREDDGLRAAIELRRRLPELGVLILSQYCEPAFAVQLIGDRPEGVGYLLKERPSPTPSPRSAPAAAHWTLKWSAGCWDAAHQAT
jgi:DNA-binding NarL/FixJ family response regulator